MEIREEHPCQGDEIHGCQSQETTARSRKKTVSGAMGVWSMGIKLSSPRSRDWMRKAWRECMFLVSQSSRACDVLEAANIDRNTAAHLLRNSEANIPMKRAFRTLLATNFSTAYEQGPHQLADMPPSPCHNVTAQFLLSDRASEHFDTQPRWLCLGQPAGGEMRMSSKMQTAPSLVNMLSMLPPTERVAAVKKIQMPLARFEKPLYLHGIWRNIVILGLLQIISTL